MLVVPEEIQRKIHERGHVAVSKTEYLVKQEFYTAVLTKKVETLIAILCLLYLV